MFNKYADSKWLVWFVSIVRTQLSLLGASIPNLDSPTNPFNPGIFILSVQLSCTKFSKSDLRWSWFNWDKKEPSVFTTVNFPFVGFFLFLIKFYWISSGKEIKTLKVTMKRFDKIPWFNHSSICHLALLTPCFLQQWIDLARATGVQSTKKELPSPKVSSATEMPLLECGMTEVQNVDDSSNQTNDLT